MMLVFVVLFTFSASWAWAEEIPLKDCEEFLAKRDKDAVASAVSRLRQGLMTVEVNGQLIEKIGTQDSQFITSRSICADINRLGIPLRKLAQQIRERQQMTEQIAQEKTELERRQAISQEQRMRRETEYATAERQRISSMEAEPGCKDEATARVIAKEFVTKSLKAPATAEFPWFWKDQYRYLGSCRHQISSYVDAPNSFGAQIRNYYVVVVRFAGGEKWVLDDIKFSR